MILLDTIPLGMAAKPPGKPDADACRKWIADCAAKGIKIFMPEISGCEVRRELLRTKNINAIARLDTLQKTASYLPITTPTMLLAAELWAQVRNAGLPTADPHALDGDVILCAQALTMGLPPTDFIAAMSNVKHLSRFVPADEWTNINP